MKTTIGFIKDEIWPRLLPYIPYVLVGVIISQITAYYLWGHPLGWKLLGTIASLSNQFLIELHQGLCGIWGWLNVKIGPMMFGLFPLTVICIWSILKLIKETKLTDMQVMEKARAHYGESFVRLYRGDCSGIRSRFEAEKRLSHMLACFSNNRKTVIDRLIRRSGMYGNHWDDIIVRLKHGSILKYGNYVVQLSLSDELESDRPFHFLEAVSELSVTFGFAGTVIALMFTMGDMSADLSQSEMIDMLFKQCSSAFGSTIYGLFLSVAGYLGIKFFRRYIPYDTKELALEERLLFDAVLEKFQSNDQDIMCKLIEAGEI